MINKGLRGDNVCDCELCKYDCKDGSCKYLDGSCVHYEPKKQQNK